MTPAQPEEWAAVLRDGVTAARIRVMERREVREAVVAVLWLIAFFFGLLCVVIRADGTALIPVSLGAIAAVVLVALAWRRGAWRHPHGPAFAVALIIAAAGSLVAPMSQLIALTMMGLNAVVVVGWATLMPWSPRWHAALLVVFGLAYLAASLVTAPQPPELRVSLLLVGAAAFTVSAPANLIATRRRRRRWAVELALRRQRVELRRTVEELQGAWSQLSRLEGILPICLGCHRIEDAGRWVPVEAYVTARTEALFSHGICPECMARLYPEYA
jgi:hypothetical protein